LGELGIHTNRYAFIHAAQSNITVIYIGIIIWRNEDRCSLVNYNLFYTPLSERYSFIFHIHFETAKQFLVFNTTQTSGGGWYGTYEKTNKTGIGIISASFSNNVVHIQLGLLLEFLVRYFTGSGSGNEEFSLHITNIIGNRRY
jgi:hypothetical protein